ncbi:MAG: arylsulfatase [Verrucomicrobiales bacterium]|nr:arylsulfatase [Verrucomicrobiales bacterium]
MRFLLSALLVFLGSSVYAGGPNVIFIFADDLGWGDIGCYGNEWFETPHLDKLAVEGMRFTNAYAAAPICSASRAGVLTGKTPARLGFEFVTKHEEGYQPIEAPLRAPPYTMNLPLEEVTIPEMISDRDTGFFGKWHLNKHHNGYLGWSPTHGPKAQGFDVAIEDFGSHPYSYRGKNADRSFLDLPKGEFPTDAVTENAIEFLRAPHEQPFFLMVSHFYVHDPIHTRVKWLHDHYLEKIPDTHPRKAILAHYGAMVTALDHYVGQVVAAVDEHLGDEKNLIIFTSDNGGHPNYFGNAPLRGSKWNLYEGGIRVPFIARWKDTIAKESVNDTPVWSLDIAPSVAELANVEIPDNVDGQSLLPILQESSTSTEGRTFIWHFPYYHPEKGYSEAPLTIGSDDGVTSKTKPHSAIRKGDWKLLHFYEDGRNELYFLPDDLSEENDLSEAEPEVAKRLLEELQKSLEEAHARFPDKNPNYHNQ